MSSIYTKVIKRLFDVVFSFLALVVLSPVFLLFAVVIKLDSKGPVFFKQKRIGKNRTHFMMVKFRTMSVDTPANTPTHQLENPDSYITRFGAFLRHSSLDELPQVWNIFKGEMSIIGPRPALWNQYDLIDCREKLGANALRPGLTGYAQINGRDELPIKEKAELDGYYAKHISFWLDVRVFFGTILRVFTGSGVVEGKEE